jgi:hypothetical protein
VPYPRKLPDDDTLWAHLERGDTQREIAARYGVSQSTVSKAMLGRLQLASRRARSQEIYPWPVDPRHRETHASKMLRCWHRRCVRKLPIRPVDERYLVAWLTRWEGFVVTYHPERGFGYAPRELRDGRGMVRRWRVTR